MVISIRLDGKGEQLFHDLKKKLVGKKQLQVQPTNSQIIKAALIFAADHCGLNVEKYKEV